MGLADNNGAGGDEALKRRLETLTKALDGKRQDTEEAARAGQKGADGSIGKAMGTGFRVASELAAAILVGGVMGWQLDKWFGTDPWLLLVFLLLGVVAGFWNVYKMAAQPTSGSTPPER